MEAETRYAKSGDLSIAYQVHGEGPVDLLLAPGYLTHLEQNQWWPGYEHFRAPEVVLASDPLRPSRNGPWTGSWRSDRSRSCSTTSVLCSTQPRRKRSLWSVRRRAGSMCAPFAATFPERTSALVLNASYATHVCPTIRGDSTTPLASASSRATRRAGGASASLSALARSMEGDEEFRRWYTQACRFAGTPTRAPGSRRRCRSTYARFSRDPRAHADRPQDRRSRRPDPGESAPGREHQRVEAGGAWGGSLPVRRGHRWPGRRGGGVPYRITANPRARSCPRDRALHRHRRLDGARRRARGSALDGALAEHHRIVRTELDRHRGKIVRIEGDGTLSTFDVRLRGELRNGYPARAHLCRRGDPRRPAHRRDRARRDRRRGHRRPHRGTRRVARRARRGAYVAHGEVDLVVGSGIAFVDRGTHALKGVPGEWQLYAVDGVG